MLKLCDTCNGRGTTPVRGWPDEWACPTCEGSGFSNATSAQARHAELIEAQLAREVSA